MGGVAAASRPTPVTQNGGGRRVSWVAVRKLPSQSVTGLKTTLTLNTSITRLVCYN